MASDFGGSSPSPSWCQAAGKGQKVVDRPAGSYGGIVMIGMLSSVAGLGLFDQLSVSAGLILGRMAYRRRTRTGCCGRAPRPRPMYGALVDDISFSGRQENRVDRFEIIHRTLRDRYRDIANEISRSLNDGSSPPSPPHTSKKSSATTRIPWTTNGSEHPEPGHRERG